MSVGKRIKKLREVKGMTQQDFATKMDVHRSMVAKYESDHPMSIEALVKMCELLETTPDFILGYRETQHVNNGSTVNLENRLVHLLVQELEEKRAELAALKASRS